MASINTSVGNFTPIENSENINENSENVIVQSESTIGAEDEGYRYRYDSNKGVTFQVSDFNNIESVKVSGNYTQNFVEIPQYDLSSIHIFDDEEDYDFNYILSIIDGIGDEPNLYCTSKFFDKIIQQKNLRQPHGVNQLTHQRDIVVIDIQPLKKMVEDMRIAELNLDIDITNSKERRYVEVLRNIFVISNYTPSDEGLVASPTINIRELIKYISWVSNKPPADYNQRLLPAEIIGDFRGYETATEYDPSDVLSESYNGEYAPVGRIGEGDEEEVLINGIYWTWNPSTMAWERVNQEDNEETSDTESDTGSGNQGGSGNTGSGNTGSGNQGGSGNTGSGNTGSYSPIGRAGTSQGEVVVLQTQPYLWDGTRWLRVTL